MKLTIYLRPSSSKNEIEKLSEDSYRVRVTEQPVDNKANEALIKLLSEYFNVPKTNLKIVRGHKSKTKIIKIN